MKNEDIVLLLARVAVIDDLNEMRAAVVRLASSLCEKRADNYTFAADIVMGMLASEPLSKKRLVRACAEGAGISSARAAAVIDRMTVDKLIMVDSTKKLGSNRSIVYVKCSNNSQLPEYSDADLPAPDELPPEEKLARARMIRGKIRAMIASGSTDKEKIINEVQQSTNCLRTVIERQYVNVTEIGLTEHD